MLQRNFLYLVNPISGTRKKTTLRASIEKFNTERNLVFEITDTKKDGDYAYLREKINTEKITDIIICGGDGSVSTLTSYLLDVDVAVGIIPTGSGNGLALAAGISSSTLSALKIIYEGHSSFIDGFLINDIFSCMMCGIGNDAQIAHEFALTKVRGLQTYLKLSARNYFISRPYSFTIKTGNSSATIDAFFITIANSNQFGNNVTIAPRASLSDGLLDVVIVKNMHKLILPFALFGQIAGINTISELKHYQGNRNIEYFQTSDIEIINNSEAPLHIDGEPFPLTKNIKIKILPKAFRLLQPLR